MWHPRGAWCYRLPHSLPAYGPTNGKPWSPFTPTHSPMWSTRFPRAVWWKGDYWFVDECVQAAQRRVLPAYEQIADDPPQDQADNSLLRCFP